MPFAILIAVSLLFIAFDANGQGIYNFKGGVRIPASSCANYSSRPSTQLITGSGGLTVYDLQGPIEVVWISQLPVPEKARIRQFVIVGNVEVVKFLVENFLSGS